MWLLKLGLFPVASMLFVFSGLACSSGDGSENDGELL